ncbi:hypothetical protein Dsin_000112 [Dipteronia sinensis]|uniref:Plant bHLH transcription factor ACT-like domain-containing protein n=1 Tax=Dipteronia sinensis TaxID=43782 RepID=A0AAD9Z5M1_9ROSI|nr:hypothetical protein Dsin_000112 [Dipteronia sinensis]
MVSREQKKLAAVMYMMKLQVLLRSIANSYALSKTSVASKYIQELKQKIEKTNIQNMVVADQVPTDQQTPSPLQIRVEAGEKSILIKVFNASSCSCRGLLVFILEAFEEVGLDVLHARVSCSNGFLLEAAGVLKKEAEKVDAQKVEAAVLQAIQSWSEINQ